MTKPILFLDNNTISSLYGRASGDVDRFIRLLNGLNEQYDLRVTDVIYKEATFGELDFPKDAAFKQWFDQQSGLTQIQTSIGSVANAGELSILEVIQNDPVLYDSDVGAPRPNTFTIASNDTSFFASNQDGAAYVNSVRSVQVVVSDSTVKNFISPEDFKSLSTQGTPALTGGWDDYRDVTVAAIENKYSVTGSWVDDNGVSEFSFEKEGKKLYLTENDLFGGTNLGTTAVGFDDGSGVANKALSHLGQYGSVLDKAGFIAALVGSAIVIANAHEKYQQGDYEGVGELVIENIGSLAGGAVFGTGTALLAAAALAASGVAVGSIVGIMLVGGAGIAGGIGGSIAGTYLTNIYEDLHSLGLVPSYSELGNSVGFYLDSAVSGLASDYWSQLGLFNQIRTVSDPLVLDLNRNGNIDRLETAGINGAYFDIDNDGWAEAMPWLRSSDGFLVHDVDNSGAIENGSEMFGDAATNGFIELKTFDLNNDNVINQFDAVWSDLQVWRDFNSDGISQSDELFTLGDFGITEILIPAGTSPGGSTMTTTSGTMSIYNWTPPIDERNTRYAGDVDMDFRTLFLPELRGYATLPNLRLSDFMNAGENAVLRAHQHS